MTRITLMLEYFHPWTNAAGFYLARDEGWFAEEGLDVEIVVPDPARGDALGHLARHDVDFGVFPSNRLFVQREAGHPLVSIAAINHRALETIQTVAATGIARPRDLAGRRLAMNPTPRGIAMVRHLVAHDGGDPDAVTIVDSGVRELPPESFLEGVADASFGSYWAWDTLFASSVPDGERRIWPVDEIGAPAYHSYLLGAHEDTLETRGELVRGFLAAARRGYLAVAREPLRGLPSLERVIPYFPTSLLRRSLPLIGATWTHEGVWGVQREALLNPYAQWLGTHGVLRDASQSRYAFTNAFLPDDTGR
ncbi:MULTISPECIES: ABC transporter substrate-binding protein [unclassified Burkholderia]|uniref:ABC transporter substrate-binding protein n=1 Tax=unclassified Burkholderia TaxID=2613784 RepID=UPI000F585F08|nr:MULTISPECIES: ABC transporter substrate-binding protein [unclassified Burkholderia]RQR73174.1 ABC transporter substrate-binding protein [Burkholderia sp. Bp9011]RQR85155.1 ABC transporter substrate-binding protein [Burkholderia sp. Bp9010]RQS18445.1 ABC transporter substrate-binding protein [Burkholderia sp. Bp8995]RQS38447.1 ABC transporter substrate-binding protein [Burkholderia sp. Bp8989]RQS64262.1 ABC transporter substrate-binding protein [Burkholderia sp. Bp8977]